MPPDHHQMASGEGQGLRNELAELSIADDEDTVIPIDRHLFLNLQRGGQRLGEKRILGLDLFRNDMKRFIWTTIPEEEWLLVFPRTVIVETSPLVRGPAPGGPAGAPWISFESSGTPWLERPEGDATWAGATR